MAFDNMGGTDLETKERWRRTGVSVIGVAGLVVFGLDHVEQPDAVVQCAQMRSRR